MSYIVKNCPCYIDMPLCHHDKVCRLGDRVKPNHKELYVYCQGCTDCVIKQVIDKLREADNSCNGLNCTECSGFYMCHSQLANKILQLFDIEEIKE